MRNIKFLALVSLILKVWWYPFPTFNSALLGAGASAGTVMTMFQVLYTAGTGTWRAKTHWGQDKIAAIP